MMHNMDGMDNMDNMNMPSHDSAQGPAIGLHGMLIVGEESIYLSHLPMWMSPHNFQVILQVTLTEAAQTRYVNDRKTTGTKLYTLNPAEKFDIKELAPTGPQGMPLRPSFPATIWRNHFEDHPVTHPGERFLIGNAEVLIENIVYFQELRPQGQGIQDLEYILFGKGQELFLAHVITKPPDFDQIVSVQVADSQFTDEDLLHGVLITFPGRTNSIAHKIKEEEQLSGRVQVAGQNAPQMLDRHITAVTEFYFETEDLEG